ncbi:MAG: cell division protein FtsW, partial [Candidatus Schekmanbacteria bacterium RBG_13_48_7]
MISQYSPSPPRFDYLLFLSVLCLLGIGLTMVFSSSAYASALRYNNVYYFLFRQLIWMITGLIIMFCIVRLDYHILEQCVYPVMALSFIMLHLVLIPGIGLEINGARRWLRICGFTFQPAEFAKLAVVLYISHVLSRKITRIREFKFTVLPLIIILSLYCILIKSQPDLGSAIMLAIIAVILIYVAGIKIWHLIALGTLALPVLYFFIMDTSYRRGRIMSFFDPWADSLGAGWQIIQSFLAFGIGGALGVGFGNGKQKLLYLPESHTDFIFSVIGEEFGLLGTLLILALFLIIIQKGIHIAIHAPDLFGTLVAVGITTMVGLQAMLNMGVVLGLFPTKGLPLPFISYGGSSLWVNLVGVGILLNIGYHIRP